MRFFTPVMTHDACGKEPTIIEVGFSNDGHVLFKCICIPCGREFTFTTTMEQLIIMAQMELNHQTYAVEGHLTDN